MDSLTHVVNRHLNPSVSSWGLPQWLRQKESACNAGDLGLILGLGRSQEKGMATYSSIIAWRIPWTEEHELLDMKDLAV